MPTSNSTLPDDVVDFRAIGQRVSGTLLDPVNVYRRNKGALLLFTLAGIAIAFLMRFLPAPVYKASFIIRPADPREKLHLKVLADVQTLVKQGHHEPLVKMLGLDLPLVQELKDIDLYNSFSRPAADSVNYTEISIYSESNDHFTEYQNALMNYLAVNPYYSLIRKLQREQVNEGRRRVERDLADLDSLKQLQLRAFAHSPAQGMLNVPVADLLNPVAAYTVSAERQNKRNALLAQEAFMESFQLIKPCTAFKRPHSPARLLMLLIICIPALLLTGYVVLRLMHR